MFGDKNPHNINASDNKVIKIQTLFFFYSQLRIDNQ